MAGGPGQVEVGRILDYGDVATLYELSEQIGLREVINRHTDKNQKRGLDVGGLSVIMTINRCVDPRSKMGIPEWYGGTCLPELMGIPREDVNYQVLTRTLDYLTEDAQVRIEHETSATLAVKRGLTMDRLLYDITSTYLEGEAEGSELARHGYSRDHRPDRKQVNIALAVTKEPLYPIYHRAYPGNTHDTKTLPDMVKTLEAGETVKNTVVLDRGMSSRRALRRLEKRRMGYVAALKMTEKLKEQVLAIPRSDYKLIREEKFKVYAAQRVLTDKRGRPRSKLIYIHSQRKAERDRKSRQKALEKAYQELEALKPKLNRYRLKRRDQVERRVALILKKSRVGKLIDWRIEGEEGSLTLSYSLNQRWLKRAELLDGKYVLATNRLNWTPAQVYQAYNDRSRIERAFKIIKGPLKIRPIWHRKDSRIRAHVFVCFLAFLLRCLLEHALRSQGEGMSVDRCLRLLGKLKMVELRLGDRGVLRTTTPNKEQRALLTILGIGLPG